MFRYKVGLDNFRQSAIQGVIDHIKDLTIVVVVYEPVLEADEFNGCKEKEQGGRMFLYIELSTTLLDH